MWDLGGKWLIHRGIHNKLMKYVPRLFLLFVVLMAATAVHAQSLCTVSGVVYAPDGSTIDNGTVTFTPAGQVPQIIGGQAIYPKYVSTTTDSSGNLVPISLLQGAAMNVTICQAGGSACSAPVYVSVPAESSVSFGLLLANTQISFSGVPLNDLAQPATGNYNMGGFGFLDLDELIGAVAGMTIQGNSITGTDNLNQFNVNGVLNVQTYGAVCSATTVNVTTASSSPTVVASGSVGDFKVGQYVSIPRAGASNTLTTPTISSVSLNGYNNTQSGLSPEAVNILALASPNGFCTVDTLGLPQSNAACSTEYCYTIQSVGQTGIGTGLNNMHSAQSAAVCVTDGPATLSFDNHVVVAYTLDANTVGTIIRQCHSTGSCVPSTIIAVMPGWNVFGANAVYYTDMGNDFGMDTTGLSSATAADVDAQITAINGLNITLSVAPTQIGTFTMYHDTAPNFQAAVNASCAGPGTTNCAPVFVPACAKPYPMSQAMSLWGIAGGGLTAHTSSVQPSGQPVQIQWNGPAGGIVFNDNYSPFPEYQGIGYLGGAGNSPGTLVDGNRYGDPSNPATQGPGAPASSATAGSTPTNSRIEDVDCGEDVGLCFDLSGDVTANLENQRYLHDSCDQGNGSDGGWACFYSNSQETYNEVIDNASISDRDFGFYFRNIGSFQAHDTNMFGNVLDVLVGTISTTGLFQGITSESNSGLAAEYVQTGTGSLTTEDSSWTAQSLPDGHIASYQGQNLIENTLFLPEGGGATNNIAVSNIGYGGLTTFNKDGFLFALANPAAGGGVYPPQPYGLPIDDGVGGQHNPIYTATNNAVAQGVYARYARDGISAPIELDFTGPLSAWESKTLGFNCSTNLTIPANFTGPTSSATCGSSPSGTFAITIAINGSTVGTITPQTSCSTTPATGNVVLGTATATTCTPGQRLTATVAAAASGSDLFLNLQATY
jgi:hypothetical protein